MALSDPLFTPEALRNLAKDNGPEFAGRSRRALRWCADVIEAADAVVQESAEVRKDDEALIRQMLEALETCGDGDGYNGPYQYYETVPVEEAITAARARLEKAP